MWPNFSWTILPLLGEKDHKLSKAKILWMFVQNHNFTLLVVSAKGRVAVQFFSLPISFLPVVIVLNEICFLPHLLLGSIRSFEIGSSGLVTKLNVGLAVGNQETFIACHVTLTNTAHQYFLSNLVQWCIIIYFLANYTGQPCVEIGFFLWLQYIL